MQDSASLTLGQPFHLRDLGRSQALNAIGDQTGNGEATKIGNDTVQRIERGYTPLGNARLVTGAGSPQEIHGRRDSRPSALP